MITREQQEEITRAHDQRVVLELSATVNIAINECLLVMLHGTRNQRTAALADLREKLRAAADALAFSDQP